MWILSKTATKQMLATKRPECKQFSLCIYHRLEHKKSNKMTYIQSKSWNKGNTPWKQRYNGTYSQAFASNYTKSTKKEKRSLYIKCNSITLVQFFSNWEVWFSIISPKIKRKGMCLLTSCRKKYFELRGNGTPPLYDILPYQINNEQKKNYQYFNLCRYQLLSM